MFRGRRTTGRPRPVIFTVLCSVVLLANFLPAQDTILPNGATWRWAKGTNEVSNPTSLWRGTGFNDATWSVGNAPFHYGEGLAGGTLLSDMRSNYTCIFLRVPLVVTNVVEIASAQFVVNYDDGFVAWINGTEVARASVTPASPVYTHVASVGREADPAVTFVIGLAPASYLQTGTNILAVQAFNSSVNSSDFRFETMLQVTKLSLDPPVITSIVPAPDSVLGALTEITVQFSKAVSGVDPQDLLLNGQPASSVSGNPGTNRYTFTFTQPLPGLLEVRWNDSPGITDLQGGVFDATAPGTTWSYTLVDNIAPVVSQRTPVAGATVSQLTQVELFFSEPVTGVDAADLLINGQPATSVNGTEAGPYLFSFAQPTAGTVNFSWAGGYGIADLAANAFAAAGWSVTLNPALTAGDVIINEFVAGNLTGLMDEDGERQDWIEIYNRGTNIVNLLGWSLTDDPGFPGKWIFPSKTLNPGQYLVVFASGKDRRAPVGANKYHTDFKLDLFGEYLALFNAELPRVAASVFTPKFPEQRNNYSYGLDSSNQWRYFQTPTPEAPNGNSSIIGIAPEPHFSVGRGLFDQPFNLLLTTPLPGATIRYTTDGSEPTLGNGFTFGTPIAITNTAIIRAAVFASNYLPSRTRTHSYIYLDSIVTQPNNPPGFPSSWGVNVNFSSANVPAPYYVGNSVVPAYYEMDLDPVRVDPNNSSSAIDAEKLQRLKDGLRELPVVSLVMNVNDMFGSSGLYPNSSANNKLPNEKPCSLELLLQDGSAGFVVNGGIDLHGNASRDSFKNPKHGFKVNFKGDYGETTLNYKLFPDSPATKFDDLILRPDFGGSWRHQSDTSTEGLGAFQRSRATRFRDAYVKHSFRAMGGPASYNRHFHLMINGLYWGIYDFSEQPFGQFAENYLAASTNGYDIYDQGGLNTGQGGTATAYNAMLGINNLNNNANYEAIKQYLDVTEFSDYMLLHFFLGAQDWGLNKNWFAIRPRVAGPDGRFKYMPWDGENTLLDNTINRVPNAGGSTDVPSGLFVKLDDNAQYRLDFADRVHKHMIAPGGALTVTNNIARWRFWQDHLDKAIVAESCRWGDYRRSVHRYQSGTFALYTREGQWLTEHDRVVNSYLPARHGIVLNQFRTAGLYPPIEAPGSGQNSTAGPIVGSGPVGAGYVLAMRNPGAGTIYYTTNGSDPRVYYSGTVAADAATYSSPLTLNATTTVKARVFNGVTWSALNEATFTVAELGIPLRVTEIMYNPVGGDAYEFIELQNVGSLPLDLGGYSFEGINFIFPSGTILQPGGIIVLANNASPSAFAARYPSTVVFGYYGGNLSNGGERIAILNPAGQTVFAVHYDDEAGWATAPDGGGYSLEIIDPRGDPNAASNWRASSAVNGTPGLPPVAPALGNVVINEIMADNAGSVTNGGAFPDWVELHNRGGSATNLAGWSLTDNSNARKYVLPANTILPAGGFLVLWCDSATNAPGLHTGFALGKNGETVSLFDAATNRVDALTFGLQLTDHTVGRIANDWHLTVPTPGASNVAVVLAASTNLSLNEWLADSPPGSEDWIEVFNRSSNAPVALRGLGFGTSNVVTRYNALSFVAPRGYAQLFADELPGANHLEFKLPAAGGTVILFNESAAELDRITYAQQTESVSEGRLPDGATNIVAFPGSISPGASNYLLAWTGVVLNEVLARNDRAAVSPWGNYADFVELFNPSGSPANVGGMALGRSTALSGRWVIPSGAVIPGNGHLVIWCDGSRAASTTSGGALNAGFNLPGESGAVYLFNSSGQPVSRVEYGFQVDDLSIGVSGGQWRLLASPTPGAANSGVATLGAVTSLRINEWMAAPLAGDDWFELYNTNSLPVALGGLWLTDDPSTAGLIKSPIAPLSFIGGRKWAKFVADGSRSAGRDHTAFALARDGESVRLYTTNFVAIDILDFGYQLDDVSQGRLPDGTANLVSFPLTPTPGAANSLPLTNVVVNEVLSHTDAPLEDAIELHNPTASPVDIGGWYLSDSPSDLKRYRVPDGTVIPAGGFKVFYQYQFGPPDGEADVPPLFSFNSARGDSAYVSQADGGGNLTGYRINTSFGAAPNGVSFGRFQTSVGVEFVAMSARTFGVDNPSTLAQFRTGTGASNAYPLVGPVVINEIMYHPPDLGTNAPDMEEFIELLNLSSSPVPLYDPANPGNVWRLANAVTFDFPTGTTIPAIGTLIVVSFNPSTDAAALAAFQARYGTNGTLAGPFSGKLDNAGETVELWRPDTPQAPPHPDAGFVPQILVERVTYSDVLPWPVEADGSGASLQRIMGLNYGNDPVNWRAGLPTAGTPNTIPPTGTASLPGNGIVRLTFTVQSGLTYQVEYKENLTDNEWLPLGDPIQADDDLLIVDDVIGNGPQCFYRLTLVW